MSNWIKNLRSALIDNRVVLLHGNVRDCYVENDRIFENLTILLSEFARSSVHPQFTHFERFDLVDGLRVMQLSSPAPVQTATTTPPSQAGNLRRAIQVIARWKDQLSSTQQNRFVVLFYVDKLVSYRESGYGLDEAEAIVWLEKVIENITLNNRLVLVALQDSMVPVEVYIHSPKCRMVSIPVPDFADRSCLVRRELGEGAHEKLIADLSDGLYMRQLEVVLAHVKDENNLEPPVIRRLINHYRFGEQEDYWAQLTLSRLDDAEAFFIEAEGIKGQKEPVERVVQMLQMARAGLSGIASGTASKPKGVLFFAGPTGVGKTHLAKKLAKLLFSSEEAFIRFDMSEFKEEHTVSKLIGSPPGYVGSDQGGRLTNAIRERPFSVVLFDEIEKAHPKIMDVFLQVLDEGRLSDSRGQTAFFTEAVIIFTSNVGCRTRDNRDHPVTEIDDVEKIRSGPDRDSKEVREKVREHFIRCVQNYFSLEISRPELLNRVGGNIVPFNFIDGDEVQRLIVGGIFDRIKADFESLERSYAAGYRLEFDPEVVPHLALKNRNTMSNFGGRGIVNAIASELIQKHLAPQLLKAEFNDEFGTVFHVRTNGDDLVVERVLAENIGA